VRRPAPSARHHALLSADIPLRLAVTGFLTLLWIAFEAARAFSAPSTTNPIEQFPRRVYRTEVPAPLKGEPSSPMSFRKVQLTPPPLEEVYVFQDSLDGRPLDDEGGWTHYDNSAGPTAWHIDTFMACNNHAWWCGKVDSSWTNDSNRAGYDNSWDQNLEHGAGTASSTLVPPGSEVTLTVKYKINVEQGFDYGQVQYDDLDDLWLPLISVTGKVPTNQVGCDSFTVELPESSWVKWQNHPAGPKDLPFRFVFHSDNAYSSADGLYNGDGWIIDEVRVMKNNSQVLFYDNMENGMGTWTRTTLPAVGDYFAINSNVVTEDLCTDNRSNIWVDWDNVTRSLVPRIDNRLLTPPVDIDRAGEALIAFDVYRNLPLDACFYYSVNYRTRMIGGIWSAWMDPTGLLYYGSSKDWIRQKVELPLAAGKDSVQCMFIVKDYGQIYCGGSTGYTNLYPLFDNVAIGVRATTPPIFIPRDLDLFQDTFKTTAFFGNDNFNTPLGDSAVVQVATSRGYKTGFMFYRFGTTGSWLSTPLAMSNTAEPTYRYADVPPGNYPGGTQLQYYFAVTDSVDSTAYLPAKAPQTATYLSAAILPLKSATNPALGCTDSLATVLFVNNNSGRETEASIAKVLTAQGYKFDTWDVNGPTSGAGNTPGGSPAGDPFYFWPGATTNDLLRYSAIIWHAGSLSQFTIGQTDQALIQSWVQQSGKSRNFFLAGDNVAQELITLGGDYNSFFGFTVGTRYLRGLWENTPQDTLHPLVTGFAGSPSAGRFMHLNLDCPQIDDPDLVAVSPSALSRGKTGLWLKYPNTFAAGTRFATKYVSFGTDSARSVFWAFNYNNVEESGERLRAIKDIMLTYFQVPACYFATAIEDEQVPAPTGVDVLYQNAPNPFNPETVIRYSVAQSGPVNLRIYNVQGALVRTLVNKQHVPGSYRIRWDGTNDFGEHLGSGVYFYRLETRTGADSKKLIMLK